MKKAVLYISSVMILVACGSSNTDKNVEALQQQKDSLKTIYDGLAKQIADVDLQLAALDTNARFALVTTKKVEVKPFKHFFDVQGIVEVGGEALIYPEAPGRIISINKKEGTRVTKGEIIAKLDVGVLQSTIKEVETNYDLVKDLFEKQERLWKEKIGSEVQYLQAKTNKESLEQKLKTLKEQADMYTIRAPFTGIIDEIMPKIGEAANPIMPVARIINNDEVFIKADVSEDYTTRISEGSYVKVYFSSLDETFETRISRIGNFINPGNRTFKISIDLNDFKGNVKPNMLADIKIQDFKQDTAIVLPTSIIQQDREGSEYIYLTTKKGGATLVKKAVIKTGLSYQNETIVIKGLEGEEEYIDKGARSIQNGDQVEISKK